MTGALVLFVSLTSVASAQADAASPFEACQSAEQAFEYVTAVTRCTAAAVDPRASPEDVVAALALVASSQIALNERDAAIQTYVRLLTTDPDFTLDNTQSPVLKDALAKARTIVGRDGQLLVTLSGLTRTETGQTNVAYVVKDPLGRVDRAHLLVDDGDDKRLTKILMASTPRRDGTTLLTATIPRDIADKARTARVQFSAKSGDVLSADAPDAKLVGAPEQAAATDVVFAPKWPSTTNLVLAPLLAGGAGGVITLVAVASLFANVGVAPALVLFAVAPLAASAASAAFVRPLVGPLLVGLAAGATALVFGAVGAAGTLIYFSPGDPKLRNTARTAANVAFIGGAIAVPLVSALTAAALAAPSDDE